VPRESLPLDRHRIPIGHGPTSRTNGFRQVIAAASLAMTPLRALKLPLLRGDSGVKVRALELSPHLPFPFGKLKVLELPIHIELEEYWHVFEVVANLLLAMPSLRELELNVSNGRKDLDRQVSLGLEPYIQTRPSGFTLNQCHFESIGFNLSATDEFPSHHKNTLVSLHLVNCDLKIEPDDECFPEETLTWPAIFEQLRDFPVLRNIYLRQLGYDGKGTYWECGHIFEMEMPDPRDFDAEAWLEVSEPNPFLFIVDDYEDKAFGGAANQLPYQSFGLDLR